MDQAEQRIFNFYLFFGGREETKHKQNKDNEIGAVAPSKSPTKQVFRSTSNPPPPPPPPPTDLMCILLRSSSSYI